MKILLPVDGSVASLTAVHHALLLVRAGLKASFVLVNVQEPPNLYDVVTVHDAQKLDEVRTAAGVHLLHTAETMLEAAGLPYESEVASGDPGHVLVDLVENYRCQAVVMGSHGADDSSGALGSVAMAMLQHSPVPVTVVRKPLPA